VVVPSGGIVDREGIFAVGDSRGRSRRVGWHALRIPRRTSAERQLSPLPGVARETISLSAAHLL
jgi:hypothetical protein